MKKALCALALLMALSSTHAYADDFSVYYTHIPSANTSQYDYGVIKGMGVALTADVVRCSAEILMGDAETPNSEGLLTGLSCALLYWPRGSVDTSGVFLGLGGGVWEEVIDFASEYSDLFLSLDVVAGAQWKHLEASVRYNRYIWSDNLRSAVSFSLGAYFSF